MGKKRNHQKTLRSIFPKAFESERSERFKKAFFPKKFGEKYSDLLGEEYPFFLDYCKKKLPRTIRPNSLKISSEKLSLILQAEGIELERHFAFENVFTVKTPLVQLGHLKEHSEGLFVVQEVSSMIPSLALSPQEGEVVLDLAAAPGMKTCHMAELMQNSGAIVAVDIAIERLKALWSNLSRLGLLNTIVVHKDSRNFYSQILFDKIMLDAPCSTEGFVRKRPDALKMWSPRMIEKKARLQKQLIQKAFSLLKPQGEMIYSTCTLSPEENEAVVNSLLQQKPEAELLPITIPKFKFREGLVFFEGMRFDSSLKKTVRVLPQDNDSEAFFIAKIRKQEI